MVRVDDVLAAKVALLEQLVGMLLAERFVKSSEPAAEALACAERLKQLFDRRYARAPEPARLLMAANTDLLFDRIAHELAGARRENQAMDQPQW